MPVSLPYRDRFEAGRQLAGDLLLFANRPDVIVLALPRGGVPVGYEVARALHAPLDVFLVRKLGVPGHEELAMGAIASGDIVVLNRDVIDMLHIPRQEIDAVIARERQELTRRDHEYRDDRPPPQVHGMIPILVDDGLATGSTMLAAVRALHQEQPAQIVVAVPVASREAVELLRGEGATVVCLATPEPFYGVGWWYQDFAQTTDAEVRDLLARANQPPHPAGAGPGVSV
ncbi:MAG TPA: phosphoribosyltransferase [Ktedonobacterales bacterium]